MVSFHFTIRCLRNYSEKLKPPTLPFQGLEKEIQSILKQFCKTLFDVTIRDGRVSDSTTRLVQKLLNLNPHQRLKAYQVVHVLDSTIATGHLSSSSPERSLLQVCVKLMNDVHKVKDQFDDFLL
jgi:hypothetical protein